MASLDQLRAWRDRLQDARFSGVREVRDSDGSAVTYKSDAELRAALGALEREIFEQAGSARSRISQLTLSKGL